MARVKLYAKDGSTTIVSGKEAVRLSQEGWSTRPPEPKPKPAARAKAGTGSKGKAKGGE